MSDIMSYNGAAVIAMKGKNCVAIASDLRLGAQFQTVDCNFKKIYKITDQIFIGFNGLQSDAQTFAQLIIYEVNSYKLRENREISPEAFASLVRTLQYKHRFGPYFVEPVIAGLNKKGEPFVDAMDTIGAGLYKPKFAVSATCAESLLGTCEAFYKDDMEPDELFEVISQCLLSSVDRDAYSGWGGEVYIVTPETITVRKLKTRMD
ncbi:proteasome subunit beta [Blastocystis sp. subtype 4]|uniref:proteasome subunit beta n=1 Tax=Blastocystis sp. subtype 4 TaxID=944170 RepID=UPI00071151F7|nr:proteasome subunit beta [Blastocystis sp. subtype 4]KNB43414.1 proteasome subunit beta [Blastocystis sp. subtype 4]|eukprot:XP_014526855.1 proteasome subunit beta [Blastocystis sp. subtype 4]